MLYGELIHEAMKLVIVHDDEASGHFFLDPNYRALMTDANLLPESVTDRKVDWDWISEVLRLEVERRSKMTDKTRFLVDWVFEILTSTVEPAVMQEENEMIKNIIEYIKHSHELKDKEVELQDREADLEHKEDVLDKKDALLQLVPGMNFSKRGAK